MSIATEIARLQKAKTDIKQAIENKGVTVGDGTISTYAGKISQITGGGGGEDTIYAPRYISFANAPLTDLTLELKNLDGRNLESLFHFLYESNEITEVDLSHIYAPNLTDIHNAFYSNDELRTIKLGYFDTSKVKNMSNAFSTNPLLESMDISGLDFSSATNGNYMFQGDEALETVVMGIKNAPNLNSCNNMFSGCKKLVNLDMSGFIAPNITSMTGMFNSCSSLTSIDLSNIGKTSTSSPIVTNMFKGCTNLKTVNLSGFRAFSGSTPFASCTNLTTIIIDRPNMMTTTSSTFSSTNVASGTCFIYVPDDLVETYKANSAWSTYADQIKGISELPI